MSKQVLLTSQSIDRFCAAHGRYGQKALVVYAHLEGARSERERCVVLHAKLGHELRAGTHVSADARVRSGTSAKHQKRCEGVKSLTYDQEYGQTPRRPLKLALQRTCPLKVCACWFDPHCGGDCDAGSAYTATLTACNVGGIRSASAGANSLK